MKKLALHWWILIGMAAGVLFGIAAAQLDAARIRALVEEIDACIALMPHTRDMAATELLSA